MLSAPSATSTANGTTTASDARNVHMHANPTGFVLHAGCLTAATSTTIPAPAYATASTRYRVHLHAGTTRPVLSAADATATTNATTDDGPFSRTAPTNGDSGERIRISDFKTEIHGIIHKHFFQFAILLALISECDHSMCTSLCASATSTPAPSTPNGTTTNDGTTTTVGYAMPTDALSMPAWICAMRTAEVLSAL